MGRGAFRDEDGTLMVSQWPRVGSFDWCGDFERVSDHADAEA
jgi:hypothetical protein